MTGEACVCDTFLNIPPRKTLPDYNIDFDDKIQNIEIIAVREEENTMPLALDHVLDNNLKVHTIGIKETGIYGEGRTFDKAYEDLINNIVELIENISECEINYYFDSLDERIIVNKLLRCGSDRFKIRKLLYSDL